MRAVAPEGVGARLHPRFDDIHRQFFIISDSRDHSSRIENKQCVSKVTFGGRRV